MQKFSYDLQPQSDHSRLRLSGVIDEDNTLSQITGQLKGQTLIMELSAIERINSCGVRDWVNWLNSIEAVGMQVVMTGCSTAIVSQVNMVTNFCGDAFIHSFYAPYFNADTDSERSILLYSRDLVGRHPIRAPEVQDVDGTPLEFDDYEESYFAFIKDLKGRELPPPIEALAEASAPSPPQPSKPSRPSTASPSSEPAPRVGGSAPVIPGPTPKRPPDPLASAAMPLHEEESGSNKPLVIGLAVAGVLIVGVILWLVMGG